MMIDLREEPAAADLSPDICVIGAGAAGITLARALMQKGLDVCLLESGGLDFEQATQDLYRGSNIGMPYYDLDHSRLRFFGGTVAIWGGRCALLDPIDFERREWVAHSGWPIRRKDLDPFYRRAHGFFDLGRFNYEEEVWRELGLIDPGLDPGKLDVKLWRFDEMSERFTAARARDLSDAPRVRILTEGKVVKL
jgi:choline dehydrogenase-like flavoprotein